MKKFIGILILFLFIGCNSKEFIEIKKIDKFLSLVKDNDNNILFKSKGSGDCPYKYVYSNSAYSHLYHYYFTDDKYKYTVSVHLCDNIVTYSKK